MKLVGLCRIGRDAEVRYTTDGTPVANFSVAFHYGRKDADGKRPTQWVSVALWGERAEKVSEYLTRGRQVFLVCSDVHVETYEKREKGGTGVRMVARVDDLDLVAVQREDGQAPAPAPSRASAPAPSRPPSGFDDMDDDVPF